MKLCVAAIQLPAIVDNVERRLADIEVQLRAASGRGVRFVVLPELSLTGFEFNPRVISRSEVVPGPAVEALGELARKYDLIAVAGLSERSGSDCFNTFVVVGPDGYLGKYRKIHVSITENGFWRSGTQASIVETDIGRVGLGICADMTYRTPWTWYRNGVDILAVGSAWPDWRGRRHFPLSSSYRAVAADAVRTLPVKLSRALGVPVLHANCCGPFSTELYPFRVGLNMTHRGGSNVVCGATVVEAAEGASETLLVAEVPLGSGHPDPSAWNGPWIPGSSAFVRFQTYATDAVLNAAFRTQYVLSRSLRERFFQESAA